MFRRSLTRVTHHDLSPGVILLLPLAAIFFVALAVYGNSLFCGFVYDDNLQVVQNPWIKNTRHITDIFSHSILQFRGIKTSYYRPMMNTVYMITYHIVGLKPWGFHLVNMLFHAGSSVLVFGLSSRLLRSQRPPFPRRYLLPPLLSAMIFAAHPVHTEAVTWIAGLPDVSFSFFCLLSFYCYIRARDVLSVDYLCAAMCFALAVFCKETALIFPVILAAYDYSYVKGERRLSLTLLRYIPNLLIGGAYLFVRIKVLGGFLPIRSQWDLTGYQAVITTFPLFAAYLQKMVMPLNLNFWPRFAPYSSLFEGRAIVPVLLSGAFLSLIFVTAKRYRVIFMCLVFILVPLLPALYVKGIIGKPFAERYLYLPSVGFSLLFAYLTAWAAGKKARWESGTALLVTAVAVFYAAGTVVRNTVWENDITLFSDTVEKCPGCLMPRKDLANAFMDSGDLDEAMKQYRLASHSRGTAEEHLLFGDNLRERGWIDKAAEQYNIAVKMAPGVALAHNNLGTALFEEGRIREAMEEFESAVRLNPRYAKAHYNLGVAYGKAGKLEKAIEEFQICLQVDPAYSDAHFMLGKALRWKGAIDQAIEELEIALKLNPDNAELRKELEITYSLRR
jgi:tetratricopeptide (TPR) repeat protein